LWVQGANLKQKKETKTGVKVKHSINRQFTMIFIALMAGTILLSWFLNRTFLERYYINNKTHVLLEAYDTINEAGNDDTLTSDDFQLELQKIFNKSNINMIILDFNTEQPISTDNDDSLLRKKLMDSIFDMKGNNADELKKLKDGNVHYLIQRTIDPRIQTEYIEMWGYLDNGDPFMIRTAVESIRESVDIANRFMAYVGAVSILISAVIIWLITRKITKPINELAKISERMIHLDFDAKYTRKGKNEIAMLGGNINSLSETLEKTISELKTANVELMKDIENKDKIDEMRKEFLSNVSHELKTPIALIQGYAEGLKEGINDDSDSKDFYCEVIMDEASKMNIMVKKLLTLNQLEFGNDMIAMERFDVADVVRGCVNSASILTKQNGITINFTQVNPIFVWADEFKIEEVITNYLTNAMNHADFDKVIDVKLEQHDNLVRVSVFNTGIPIPEDSIPHIWEKFYKVDKARTRAYGGSGVGLSIVKAIMDSLNQKFGVLNYNNGVEFWFELEVVNEMG